MVVLVILLVVWAVLTVVGFAFECLLVSGNRGQRHLGAVC